MNKAVYACDVGSTKPGHGGDVRFGWARAVQSIGTTAVSGGADIDELISSMRADVAEGLQLSLGMECPLFLPAPRAADGLSCGRQGEGSRSCFAPAGGYVAILGLHQIAYVL